MKELTWEEVSRMITEKIKIGTDIPKPGGGSRQVTRIDGERIYQRTGVTTDAEKYINKRMIKHAFIKINFGEKFISDDLALNFPNDYRQGDCVFSMTGGILEYLGIAEYHIGGYVKKT